MNIFFTPYGEPTLGGHFGNKNNLVKKSGKGPVKSMNNTSNPV
jgi:hypothetical protein